MYPSPLSSDFDDRDNYSGLQHLEDDGNEKSCYTRYADSHLLSKDNSIWQFFRASSLHGFKYVGIRERGVVERIFWAVGTLGCMGFSVYLIYIGVVVPLTSSPVLISFQSSDITIDQIPFPAITICNVNKVKRSEVVKLERRVKRYMDCIEEHSSEEKCYHLEGKGNSAFDGLQYLGIICRRLSSFAKSFKYSSFLGRVGYDAERDLNYTNLTFSVDENDPYYRNYTMPILRRALMNCSEMILRCLFQNVRYSCEHLFSTIYTEFGNCCVFNMVPHIVLRNLSHQKGPGINDSVLETWRQWNMDDGLVKQTRNRSLLDLPRHQLQAGMNTGLSVLLNPRLDQYHCTAQDSDGFRILAHSPIDSPHVLEFGKAVEPNSETFVGIKAEITRIDKLVRPMSLNKRECYLQGEFTLNTAAFYTETNCLDECIANVTFERCECLRYYQPREASRPICSGDIDTSCVEEAFDEIDKKGLLKICPMCFPTCTDVQYYMETNSLPMRSDVDLWIQNGTGRKEKWSNANLSIVHFYFTSDYVESRVRKSLYGWRQIVANTGGLLGLAIGFSIISIVEPLYFLTIRYLSGSQKKSSESETNNKISPSLVSSKQPLKISCRPQPLQYLP